MFIVGVQVRAPTVFESAAGLMQWSNLRPLFFLQSRALTRAYEALLKDRAIIAAEVMHEYDEKVRKMPHVTYQWWLTLIIVREPARKPRPQGCSCDDARIGDGQRLGMRFQAKGFHVDGNTHLHSITSWIRTCLSVQGFLHPLASMHTHVTYRIHTTCLHLL